jgi:thiamine biosynthesis lipoprotein
LIEGGNTNRGMQRWMRVLLWLGVVISLGGCLRTPTQPLVRYEFESVQMAIPFRIVLYARDGQAATNAALAAWDRVSELNRILSDYDPESALSQLGSTAPHSEPVPVPPELYQVLNRATEMSRASDGAFDITVGPLTQLWRRSRRQRELPTPERLREPLAAVDWRAIELHSPDRVRLLRRGMRLDAGGIAKGYALDEATRILRQHGIRSSLVAGAGDLVVTEPPPDQPGWRIEIAPIDAPSAPPARTVWLRNASLCTSGDLFQHVEIGGQRYSHIVDPRVGLGITDHSLVTVIGPDGITCDALSTAISVAGPARALDLARQFDAEVLVVRLPGQALERVESDGFRNWESRTR